MIIPTILACFLFFSVGVTAVLGYFYRKNLGDLKRLEAIENKEDYLAECERKAQRANARTKKYSDEYRIVHGNLVQLKKKFDAGQRAYAPYRELEKLDALLAEKECALAELSERLGVANSAEELAAQALYFENYIPELK